MRTDFPKLYVIADVGLLRGRRVGLREFAEGLRAAGVGVVQLRDKEGSPQEVLAGARALREVMGDGCLLVINDRVDLALLAGFGGVHVGQGDMSVGDVRAALERTPHPSQRREGWATRGGGFVVGVSTHTEEEVRIADLSSADYVAVGPVFATGTKPDAAAVVGLAGVRSARALMTKPLVAIGGITRANARSVMEAGADSVAVISAMFAEGETVEHVARDFMAVLRETTPGI